MTNAFRKFDAPPLVDKVTCGVKYDTWKSLVAAYARHICGIQLAYDRRVSVKPPVYPLNAYLRPFPCDVHRHGSRSLVITKRKTWLAYVVLARLARGYLWLP